VIYSHKFAHMLTIFWISLDTQEVLSYYLANIGIFGSVGNL
jgi:hypothetical protein